MANCMPIECTDRAGRSNRAPAIPGRPSNPRDRSENVDATSSAASTSPSRSNHPVVGMASGARAAGVTGSGDRGADVRH